MRLSRGHLPTERGQVPVTRFDIAELERRAADAPWMQRLTYFMHAVTEDRPLQAALAAAIASLCFTLAFGDMRFLVLLPAAYVALRRFRRLEREAVQDDDWL